MEFGRGPATPGGLNTRVPRTPQSRHRNRSGSGQVQSPAGLSRVNQSPCMTPSRRELASGCGSGWVSQLASTASPHSVCATPTIRTAHDRGSHGERSPISGRVRTLFSALPIAGKYSLCEQIGEGTFSTVYLAQDSKAKSQLALKHLVPTSKPSRIMMEARCMKEAGGHPNVVRLAGIWRVGGDIILAMPYLNHCKFIDLVAKIELQELKLYIANLLSALEHIHKLGIIHRDIKPSNFLYDRLNKKFSLVDFGLAQNASDFQQEKGEGRGNKRKLDTSMESSSKKPRNPLSENTATSLNCTKSPRARILREQQREGLRRSPRKLLNLGEFAHGGERSVQSPGSASPANFNVKTVTELPKRLNFGGTTPKKQPLGLNNGTPVRCSPRKLSLTNKAGMSTLKIANNSIISPDLTTPSPTFNRSTSFSLLDPGAVSGGMASQPTDIPGRTPMLRASMTSHCSSVLQPRQEHVTPVSGSHVAVSCTCPGQLTICSTCNTWPHLHAARAGTPGFRPPEVLLKLKNQTTAVDMWAAGVIMLSIMSRSYPFFRSPDDVTALCELVTLFGSEVMQSVANKYHRRISASNLQDPSDLEHVCKLLSERTSHGDSPPPCLATKEAISLLKRLLDVDHGQRVTASVALKHSFLKDVPH